MFIMGIPQLLASGIPLMKAPGVPAMDPNCCCDPPPGCPVTLTFNNCRLTWTVAPPPATGTYKVVLTSTGGFNQTYNNTATGSVDNPGSGTTWTAKYYHNDVYVCEAMIGVTYSNCECTTCSGILRPAETCVPCGCTRGRATQLAVTLSGMVASAINNRNSMSWNNGGPGCWNCTGLPLGIQTDTPQEFIQALGFDVVNGSYLFDLTSASCPTCGAFACTIAPGGYYLGRGQLKVNNDYYPACLTEWPPGSGQNPHQATTTLEVDFALLHNGATATKTSPPTISSAVACHGGTSRLSLYYRIVSWDNTNYGLTGDDNWRLVPTTHFSSTIVDGCEEVLSPTLTVDPHIQADSGHAPDWQINGCASYNIDGPYYGYPGWGGGSHGASWNGIVDWFPYFLTIDHSYTTVGW